MAEREIHIRVTSFMSPEIENSENQCLTVQLLIIIRYHHYGMSFVSKFSDKKFTYLLLKMIKIKRFV